MFVAKQVLDRDVGCSGRILLWHQLFLVPVFLFPGWMIREGESHRVGSEVPSATTLGNHTGDIAEAAILAWRTMADNITFDLPCPATLAGFARPPLSTGFCRRFVVFATRLHVHKDRCRALVEVEAQMPGGK